MSEHFALSEFLHSDTAVACRIENLPTWEHVDNLKRLAETMENIREFLGNLPITITSGYRCSQVNSAVGGVADSAHLYGLACDFIVPSYGDPLKVCKALEPHLLALDVDQLIAEGTWCHIGLCSPPDKPRCQALTLMPGGTYAPGFV